MNGTQEKWWIVVDCDPEIGRYYRSLFWLSTFHCSKLQRPAWESHITVVRNEEPPNKAVWGKYENLKIPFNYVIQVETDTVYYWMGVESQFILDLREELGLPRNPEFPLHLTIGNALSSQSSKDEV